MSKIIAYKTISENCPQKLDERVNKAINLMGYVPFGAPYGVCIEVRDELIMQDHDKQPKHKSICVNEYCQPMVKYE